MIDENENLNLDPLLLEFLDARTYLEKLQIFGRMEKIDDDMINTMAIALDTQIREGDINQRIDELKKCLLTMEKFECSRFR